MSRVRFPYDYFMRLIFMRTIPVLFFVTRTISVLFFSCVRFRYDFCLANDIRSISSRVLFRYDFIHAFNFRTILVTRTISVQFF